MIEMLKQIYSLLDENKLRFTFYVFIDSIIRVTLFITQALVIKSVIDSVIENNSEKLIVSIICFVVLVGLISVLGPISNYGMIRVIKKVIYRLRYNVFSRLTSVNIKFFDKHTSGDLISISLNDIEYIEYILHSISRLFFTILFGVTSLIMMFILSWELTIIIVIIQFVYTIGVKKLSKNLTVYNQEIIRKRGKLNQIIVGIIESLGYIKTSQLEKYWICKFENLDNSYIETQKRLVKANKNISSLGILVECLNLAIIITVGMYFLKMEVDGIGSLMAIFQLQTGVSLLFESVNQIYLDLKMSKVNFDRVNKILDEPIESIEKSIDIGKKCEKYAINISNLEFAYTETSEKIFKNFNLNVQKGEVIGIVGKSGVGKSTLIKLLLGYYKDFNGNIKLYGNDISNIPQYELRKQIAFSPQNTYLFDGTVMENIQFGNLDATENQIYEAAQLTQAHDFILELCDGYNTRLRNNGQNLSEGQRLRIGLARAIITNCEIIILDEPTASLDKITSFKFVQELKRYCKDKTLILISHDLNLTSSLDRIVDLESQ